jgi:ribonucleotide reductase alpha subunit
LLQGSREKLLEQVNEYDYVRLNKDPNLLGAYSSFEGSPASEGILQFDLWGVQPSDRYDWAKLKTSIQVGGLRNSTLLAPMPTASTSQILGFNECFEPLTSNLYSRRTLAGEFVLANKYLMRDLIKLGLWNEKIKNNIIANQGSVQQLTMVPEHIRNKYKIVWEMPMKHLIDMSADRGAFICQSQSLNLWLEDPNYNNLTSMHFYSWSKGLKTGIYYLRRKAKHQAQQFTIEPESQNQKPENSEKDEICEMCSA